MTGQQQLDLVAPVRRSDPPASQEAARDAGPRMGKQKALILGVVSDHNIYDRGTTAFDVWAELQHQGYPMQQNAVASPVSVRVR